MNVGPLFSSIGRALSKVDWVTVGKVSKDLASAALAIGGIIGIGGKSKTKKSSPLKPSIPIDSNLRKLFDAQEKRIDDIESGYLTLQSNVEEQAKVVSDIAQHLAKHSELLQTLSIRLNIFIILSLLSLLICAFLLIRILL